MTIWLFDATTKKSKEFYALLIKEKVQLPYIAYKLQRDFNLTNDQLRQIFQLAHSVTLESYVKAFQYKVLNSIIHTNTKLYKMGFRVVSAKVSLNHWTICFSIALILSSSGTILKSTGAVFQAKGSASPCKMCLSESSLKMLTLYIYCWTIL